MVNWTYELFYWLVIVWALFFGLIATLYPDLYRWGYSDKLPTWAKWIHVRPVGVFVIFAVAYMFYYRFVLGKSLVDEANVAHPAVCILMLSFFIFFVYDAVLRISKRRTERRLHRSDRVSRLQREGSSWNTTRKK